MRMDAKRIARALRRHSGSSKKGVQPITGCPPFYCDGKVTISHTITAFRKSAGSSVSSSGNSGNTFFTASKKLSAHPLIRIIHMIRGYILLLSACKGLELSRAVLFGSFNSFFSCHEKSCRGKQKAPNRITGRGLFVATVPRAMLG